jgi:hypothetical protein
MDARSGDAQVPRMRAQRIRLVRHSAIADALDKIPEPPSPPPRRVAGQRASRRRDALAAQVEAAGPSERPPEQSGAEREPFRPPEPRPRPPRTSRRGPRPEPDDPAGPEDDLLPFVAAEVDDPHRRAMVRRAVIAICAVAVLIGAAIAGYLLVHHSTKPTATATRPPTTTVVARSPAVVQAERWVSGNLARTSALRSDSTVAADLRGDGYPAAASFTGVYGGNVLVTTPAIRAQVTSGLAGAAARVSALPIAKFGSGQQQVDVTLLVEGEASGLADRLSREASERSEADRGLLTNPRVSTPAGLRYWLADGRLDLRAATTVALLAGRAEVRIDAIGLDAAEAAAGRPARTIVLSTDAAALPEVLRTLPPSYAPDRVSALSAGSHQLTWPVGLAPMGL